MKAKPGKIIKICALSLSLLMVGGIAVSPMTKAYAQEQVSKAPATSIKKIVIEYTPKQGSNYTGAWLCMEGDQKFERFVPFKDGENGKKIIETEIECADDAQIGYIIANIVQNKDNPEKYDWIAKDESYTNPKESDDSKKHNRYINVGSGGIKFELEQGNPNPTSAVKLKSLAEKVKEEFTELKAKDLRVWQGVEINWGDALEKTSLNGLEGETKELYEAFNQAVVTDASNRSSTTEILDPQKGKIRLTFKDKSTLELTNKLYVSNHITSSTHAPDDVVEIKLMAGEGVNIVDASDNNKVIAKGSKDNPTLYKEYKAKPGTNINDYKYPGLHKTVLELATPQAQEGYEKPKWTSKNGTDFKVSKENNSFIAKAVKKPAEKPAVPKKPLVPSVRPSYSRSLDYKIVPEKKTEKKVKPSEKVLKSYKNLRTSREKNVVAVKAAKLLLEIAPERVKDAKGKLEALITKSEGLVKQADTILEKLEAKYEF
ncbi:hypothetical protein [uncultured Anaerococcus sp.]|uniref:hypothetical protein n=1 Tax=uncultured Anaerococcus sp. TaxID=293428 RepID=UPI0028054A32|nr:hypothetical protein [uncultured Anaerococcus sp.]